MTWLPNNLDTLARLAWSHTYLAGVPLLVGLALAIPIGWVAHSRARLRPILVAGTGLLYTIPSLALFVLMPLLLGTRILDPINVVVAMTLYTVALLVRTVADGLDSVPEDVTAAATAMGYGRVARAVRVDLPLAVPVIAAGLRVAAVSNVSIVSVASVIGVSQLGVLLTDGFNRDFPEELWVGIVSCLLLALVFDLVIVLLARVLTPWTRVGGAR